MTGLEPSANELAGLRRADGSPLAIGGLLGSGGEGWVYQVDDRAQHVSALKLYQPTVLNARGSDMAAKLQAMVANPPGNPTASLGHPSLAWPEAIVTDRRGRFAGFTMPQLDRESTLAMHQVVNPSEQHNTGLPGWITAYEDWMRLIHTAANLAAATQSLHDTGYVIGDFNESNILVSDRALVTMIDCDSMQVPNGNGDFFLCTVGKPEFTAPEVTDFKRRARTRHADDFALAVHCFMLLMRGRHPFSGIWHGPGDKPTQLALARRGLYCIAGDPTLEPQRGTPPASVLPVSMRDLYVRAFGVPANPAGRPSAEEWKTALIDLEDSLVLCSRNPRHHYGSHLSQCPWCQMEAASAATAGTKQRPAQPVSQRPYQPTGWYQQQATTYQQRRPPYQATAVPTGTPAFQPYPGGYPFQPARRRRHRGLLAIIGVIGLGIVISILSLHLSSGSTAGGQSGNAAPPAATSAPSDSDAPTTDIELAMKAGWQYNVDDRQGITLASTGGGLTSDLGVSDDGLDQSDAAVVLSRSTTGSKSVCYGLMYNNHVYSNGWYPTRAIPLPFSDLGRGVQACMDTGGSIVLLTVTTPWDGSQIVIDAKTWKCTPPAGESVC